MGIIYNKGVIIGELMRKVVKRNIATKEFDKKIKKGFTLIELLAVIIILGILLK